MIANLMLLEKISQNKSGLAKVKQSMKKGHSFNDWNALFTS